MNKPNFRIFLFSLSLLLLQSYSIVTFGAVNIGSIRLPSGETKDLYLDKSKEYDEFVFFDQSGAPIDKVFLAHDAVIGATFQPATEISADWIEGLAYITDFFKPIFATPPASLPVGRRPKITFVKQKHWVNKISDFSKEQQVPYINEIGLSQFKILKYLLENPDSTIFLEEIDGGTLTKRCMGTYTAPLFRDSVPDTFEELTLTQKTELAKLGGAKIFLAMEKTTQIWHTSKTYAGGFFKLYKDHDGNPLSKPTEFDEIMTVDENRYRVLDNRERNALRLIDEYLVKRPKKNVILIFGNGHDFLRHFINPLDHYWVEFNEVNLSH